MSLRFSVVCEKEEVMQIYYEYLFDSSAGFQVKFVSKWRELDQHEYIIVPCNNAYGIATSKQRKYLNMISKKIIENAKDYIVEDFYGEQTPGSAFLLHNLRSSYCKNICWTSLARSSETIKDDATYNALWSSLMCIKKASKGKKMKSIVIPDISHLYTGDRLKRAIRQISECINTFMDPTSIHSIDGQGSIDRRHQFLVSMQSLVTVNEIEDTLEGLIWSRELAERGLCRKKELEVLINWILQDDGEGNHSNIAAGALCDVLKRKDTQYALTKNDIRNSIITNKELLNILLAKCLDNHDIEIHQHIEKSQLVINESIGKGGVGAVFDGKFKGNKVAIKFFEQDDSEFRKELFLLSLFNTEHIISCYGACSVGEEVYIVIELMEASLYDVLHEENIMLDRIIRVELALDIAKSVQFLHSCGIIHRDLKSLNLLVSRSFRVKICDFGLSRVVDTINAMTCHIGTVSWIAPELFGKKAYSEKADVYSFGVILWELITRKMPFENVEAFSIPLIVSKGERPPMPADCPKSWKNIIRKCWAQKASRRPNISEVVSRLTRMCEVLYKEKKTKIGYRELEILLK
eukprot:TRINITY_DN8721_c0_g3_i1.p1 TRINITY_DN8721_c0_g3~~TRINITY_DN8721_c0_g3_i1.p1  ORF type:complete len:577 (+),score=104.17 TRINITY_DN8721_c0_g3_i1:33-1763(+)